MTADTSTLREQRALRLSLYAAGAFVLMALAFALITRSDAILFDGIYSLISFFMALLTLKVANLLDRPDDEQFHFGYTALEPTLNLFKSLIVIVTCVFAVVGAISRLLSGGNPAEYGIAVIYGLLATLGCFAVAWFMNRHSQHLRSDLVGVDARTWFIDGVLSGSILLGFVSAWWLEGSSLARYAPLVDPILLVILGLAVLPIPGKIMIDSLKEVLNRAPSDGVVSDIEEQLHKTLIGIDYDHVEIRVSKRGRDLYLLVHVVLSESFSDLSISQLDDVRRESEQSMRRWVPAVVMDMMFVRDPRLAG